MASVTPRFEPTITFGNIGQMVMVGVGVVIWLLNGNNKAEQAQRDLATLQVTVSGQIAETKKDLGDKIADLQTNLRPIIKLGVQVDQHERELTDLYHRSDDTNRVVGEVNLLAHQVRSDLDGIMRASDTRITPGHR